MTREDPVRPEDAEYVFRRDGGCLVAKLADSGSIPPQQPCRDRWGRRLSTPSIPVSWTHTIAHVRDRGRGGRMGRRPPSTRRHLATVCWGHHLIDPVIDHGDVRDAVDAHLARLEGPDLDDRRPWERIVRVRRGSVSSDASDEGGSR